jgi:hypothetical protein
MKKGKKALKYADLLWGDEKLRRITLGELCRNWNLNRLLQEGELSFRMRMRSTSVLPCVERWKAGEPKLLWAFTVLWDDPFYRKVMN